MTQTSSFTQLLTASNIKSIKIENNQQVKRVLDINVKNKKELKLRATLKYPSSKNIGFFVP
jgi:hypothetical protein